jgi:hypothetical protein
LGIIACGADRRDNIIPVNIYSISIVFGGMFLLIVILLVKKGILHVKYSLLWVFMGLILLLLSIFPSFIDKIALSLDIKNPPSLLFLLGLLFLVAYSLHLSVSASAQSEKIIRLSQELALLMNKMEFSVKKPNSDE